MMREVFIEFLKLGLMSFGGPAVHIGIYRRVFVDQKRWLSNDEFGAILALAHVLPGPSSSQTGFGIGMHRAGLKGGIGAALGFALPSVIIMLGLFYIGQQFLDEPMVIQIVAALKIFAVIVVADALWSMGSNFVRNRWQLALAVVVAVVALLGAPVIVQLLALAFAAGVGWWMSAKPSLQGVSMAGVSRSSLIVFFGILALSFLIGGDGLTRIFADFYRVGSLVFGGGHVVLPMMHSLVSHDIGNDVFIAGYAAAQGLPGPIFSIAAFIGANAYPAAPLVAGLVATLAIFLPGYLLMVALIGVWSRSAEHPVVKSVLSGVNAAVVGLLGAAFIHPVSSSAIDGVASILLALIGLTLMRRARLSVIAVLCITLVAYIVGGYGWQLALPIFGE